MRYQGDITETDILTVIEGLYDYLADEGCPLAFTIKDIAWILSDIHEPLYPSVENATTSVRYHILRLRRKGYVVKFANASPKGIGRPEALYKLTEEGKGECNAQAHP